MFGGKGLTDWTTCPGIQSVCPWITVLAFTQNTNQLSIRKPVRLRRTMNSPACRLATATRNRATRGQQRFPKQYSRTINFEENREGAVSRKNPLTAKTKSW